MPGYSPLQRTGSNISSEHYQQVFEAASDGIFVLDVVGQSGFVVLNINPAFESLTGGRAADCIGRSISAAGPDPLPRLTECQRCVAKGVVMESERELNVAGGTRTFRLRLTPLRGVTGDVTCLIGELRDISADINRLKHAEEQLRQRERDFLPLAENSPDVIARFDRDMRCLYINQAVTKLTGIPADRFIGTVPGELGPVYGTADDAAQFVKLQDSCRRAFETGAVQKAELTLGNGEVFDFQIVPERNSEGVITSLVTISRDITDIRRSEATLKRLNAVLEERVATRTAELEAVNRELEKFAYTVSHDLRAPLRVIEGFVHFLLEREHARLTDDGRRMLEHIGTAGVKLGKLIEDILEYSRVGHAMPQRRLVNMAALAQEVVESMRPTYPSSQVTLGDLPQADGDPTMLRQVLQNLVNNAFKFSVRQRAPQITIGARAEQGRVVYFVADNGVGFEMHDVDKLFDVFQRLHPDRDYPGTGLGLVIVKRLVERHGGRIWVESAPDAGTTFYFTLQ